MEESVASLGLPQRLPQPAPLMEEEGAHSCGASDTADGGELDAPFEYVSDSSDGGDGGSEDGCSVGGHAETATAWTEATADEKIGQQSATKAAAALAEPVERGCCAEAEPALLGATAADAQRAGFGDADPRSRSAKSGRGGGTADVSVHAAASGPALSPSETADLHHAQGTAAAMRAVSFVTLAHHLIFFPTTRGFCAATFATCVLPLSHTGTACLHSSLAELRHIQYEKNGMPCCVCSNAMF
jgi:hypothetical protein